MKTTRFSTKYLATYGIIGLLAIWGCQIAERGNVVGASLIGSAWLAEDLEKHGVLDRAQTTLHFESQERVSGSTGCNRYSAGYKLDGNALRFGPAAATRRACVPALMDQEQRFTKVLEATTSYHRDGEFLRLFNDQGQELARLIRIYPKQ
ncbi:MAG TPA: META domain-containing protein [Candidatus Binatia bacterium]|nr:META domain-containing protein [Candidatus Binatia bacterium]